MKFVKWFFIITLGLAFLPVTIGALLIWLIIKKVQNKKLKIGLTAIVALPTLLFGFAYVYAFSHTSTSQSQEAKISQSPSPTTQPTQPLATAVLGISASPSTDVEVAKGISEPTVTATPTVKPTATPTKTPSPKPVTPKPVTPAPTVYIAPTQKPTTGGSYTCDCSRTCTQISSCAEAQYQLNVCGCSIRDNDNDGIACDSAPLHCQN